jgi:hypothetical protein
METLQQRDNSGSKFIKNMRIEMTRSQQNEGKSVSLQLKSGK